MRTINLLGASPARFGRYFPVRIGCVMRRTGITLLATLLPVASFAAPTTLDDLFLRVAGSSSGFAGAYYADDGSLRVVVRPGGKTLTYWEKRRALSALVGVFGREVLEPVPAMKRSQPGIGRVSYQTARYSFADLHRWYQRLRPVLAQRGVTFTDIDERANRLVVGVPYGKPNSAISKFIASLNIPSAAIAYEDSQDLYYYYSGSIIGNDQEPVLGGVELGIQAGGKCTLGFSAMFPNWWWTQAGFVTAGHCGSFGDWSNDTFTHPEDGQRIAAEFYNPGFIGGEDCNSNGCRYSDSALVAYDQGVEFAMPAKIIRTRDFNSDVNVDDANPTIPITGESPWLLSGDNVNKIGVGSGGGGGWTRAPITNTCVDWEAPHDQSLTFLCQYEAQSTDGTNIACQGDSGAPIFFFHETIWPFAAMAGTLLGGVTAPCSDTFIFSPMSGIREDLGEFTIPR